MKSGKAVSVHEDCSPQIVTAIESPIGADVKRNIPTIAVVKSAAPTQTPIPRRMNNVDRKMITESVSVIPR
jgi:hypothetical protein